MYCTYVYVLKDGRIVAHGKTEEVITEALIREVYEVDCAVARNPVSGKPPMIVIARPVRKRVVAIRSLVPWEMLR